MNSNDKLAESMRALADAWRQSDSQIAQVHAALLDGALAAAPAPSEPAEAVGTLTVRRYRGSDAMVNYDFDLHATLPDGSYQLYLRQTEPAPAEPVSRADELARLQGIIERDRTVFCNFVTNIERVLTSRAHLASDEARAASGFAWDEAGFIKEFDAAYSEIRDAARKVMPIFRSWEDCPKGEGVKAAQKQAEKILSDAFEPAPALGGAEPRDFRPRPDREKQND